MPRDNSDKFRRDGASNIRMLGEILSRTSICTDTGPLLSAAYQFETSKPKGKKSWGYNLAGLQFRPEITRNFVPRDVVDMSLSLSLSLSGTTDESMPLERRLYEMAIDIVTSGTRVIDGRVRNVMASWHLDKHIGDSSAGSVHPMFHFQYGGKEMEHLEDELGATLLLDIPRLLHPPMDAFIAVDFVLSNFLPLSWLKLREDGWFRSRLIASYASYWSPFFEAVAEAWQPAASRQLHSFAVFCPQLLER